MTDREAIIVAWSEGQPAKEIAAEHTCCVSWVYRILREGKLNGDERCGPRHPRVTAMWRARAAIPCVSKLYAKGIGIEAIAKDTKLPEDIVRAAVYLATKAGEPTGLAFAE